MLRQTNILFFLIHSVDSIVSNMVLEHEMSLVNAALASPQSKNKDDLMDRKQALEIKMNMLVIQVQTGILDMETEWNKTVDLHLYLKNTIGLTWPNLHSHVKRSCRTNLTKQEQRWLKTMPKAIEWIDFIHHLLISLLSLNCDINKRE